MHRWHQSEYPALPRSQVLGAARPQGLILTVGHNALTFSIPRSLNILARLVLSFQILHYVFSGDSTKSLSYTRVMRVERDT